MEQTVEQLSSCAVPLRERRGDRRRWRARTVWLALSGRGRRRVARRAEDRRRGVYLDHYSLADGVWLLAAMILCVGDALFTLFILSMGGVELNPFMAHLLAQGPAQFFWTKFLLTASGLLVILLHREFTLWGPLRGVHLLYGTTLAYAGLLAYEVYLLSLISAPLSG